MEHTDEQLDRIKADFVALRRRMNFLTIPTAAYWAAFILLADYDTMTLLGMPASVTLTLLVGCMAGVLIWSFKNWRCPECNRYLGGKRNPQWCYWCGVSFLGARR